MDKKAEIARDEKAQQIVEPSPPAYSRHDLQQEENQLPSPAYASQSNYTQASPRILDVEYSKWTLTKARVYDTATSKILYEAKIKTLKMDLIFNKPNATEPFSTVKFHTWTPKWDIQFNGSAPFTVSLNRNLNYEMDYPSPALDNARLHWKTTYHLKTIDIECRDERSIMVARMKANVWKFKKICKIELLDDLVSSDESVMDEIVVTGLAMLEYVLVTIAAAA